MRKASIIMAGLACAMIAAAYTNSVPISTNTRAATEKWTAIRFEPALPPTPENAASKFLDGNREWQTVDADQIGAATTAALAAHTNRTDNPHGVTAAQIGALTNETDDAALAALAAYASYWPRNATASSWFTFVTNSGAITITGYNIGGGTDVVIPDYINGWPVTEIGANAFAGSGATSIGGAGNVVTVGGYAFANCYSLTSVSLPHAQTFGAYAFNSCDSLTSVSLPNAQTVGEGAFNSCSSLTSVLLPNAQTVGIFAFESCGLLTSVYFDNDAPTIGEGIFAGITLNQVTIYVTNPTATGWGATLGGMPVVRPPLYADAIYQAGELVATTQYVAQAIAAIPEPDLSDRPTFAQIAASNALPYTAWTGTLTLQNGTATVAYAHGNMPVFVVPDSGATTYVTVATGTYVATSGVSRVSLSIWAGTNAIELVTNEVDYASTPDIPTNSWGTILFRRVSDGRWKGVGL